MTDMNASIPKYKRDKRSPNPINENISRVMSLIKAKNTKPELLLRRLLCANGLKGYRLHNKKLPGKPDITFNSKKIAIFVHGCFWHRCPNCNFPLPKHNTEFWEQKFCRNIIRDKVKINQLQAIGWTVFIFWECRLKKIPKML